MVSVIIPCFFWGPEAWEMTKACLESISAGYQVIVVDDASPWTPYPLRWTSFHVRNENGGYPAAVNDGMRHAQGELRVILNNDAFLEKGCIEAMVKAHKTIGQGVVCATEMGRDTRTPSGACWMIDRSTWDTFGPLDESFGVGAGEETDLFLKLRANGLKVVRCEEAKFKHQGSATLKRTPGHKAQFQKNMATLRQRWGTDIFLLDENPSPTKEAR